MVGRLHFQIQSDLVYLDSLVPFEMSSGWETQMVEEMARKCVRIVRYTN